MLNYSFNELYLMSTLKESLRLIEGISFESIINEAERIKTSSKDVYINKKDIMSRADENGFNFYIKGKKYIASDWAVNYICSSYGIPKKYISNAIHLARERRYKPLIALVNDTFNTFLNSPTKKQVNNKDGDSLSRYLVRVIGDNYIRAIRSSNFKVRDNYPLLLDIKDTVNRFYNIDSGFINHDILIMRMYLKENYCFSKEKINIGVQLKNSETGYYALQLQILISLDGIEFVSEKILDIRHNANKVSSIDINGYLKDIALRYKENIFDAIKNMIKDNKINEDYYSKILPELQKYLNKEDYESVVKKSKRGRKIDVAKTILNCVRDYDFVRKEKIENIIVKEILNLKVDL